MVSKTGMYTCVGRALFATCVVEINVNRIDRFHYSQLTFTAHLTVFKFHQLKTKVEKYVGSITFINTCRLKHND